jgi:hypothetical protein
MLMPEHESDPTRQVNPAARRDPPHEPAADGKPGGDAPAEPRPAQGKVLNPRDQGGIAE